MIGHRTPRCFHRVRRHLPWLGMVLFALGACAAEPPQTDINLPPDVSLLVQFRHPPANPAEPALLEQMASGLTQVRPSLRYIRRLAVGAYLYRVSGLTSPTSRAAFLRALQDLTIISHAEYSRRVRPQ